MRNTAIKLGRDDRLGLRRTKESYACQGRAGSAQGPLEAQATHGSSLRRLGHDRLDIGGHEPAHGGPPHAATARQAQVGVQRGKLEVQPLGRQLVVVQPGQVDLVEGPAGRTAGGRLGVSWLHRRCRATGGTEPHSQSTVPHSQVIHTAANAWAALHSHAVLWGRAQNTGAPAVLALVQQPVDEREDGGVLGPQRRSPRAAAGLAAALCRRSWGRAAAFIAAAGRRCRRHGIKRRQLAGQPLLPVGVAGQVGCLILLPRPLAQGAAGGCCGGAVGRVGQLARPNGGQPPLLAAAPPAVFAPQRRPLVICAG